MARTIKKQFWMTEEEDQDLKEKCRKTRMTEAGLLRLLVRGYEPKERPPDRFFLQLEEIAQVAGMLNQLAGQMDDMKAAEEVRQEAQALRTFRLELAEEYLRPGKKRRSVWQ